MGIKSLMTVVGDCAPLAIKNNEIKNFFGRKIAIDASMCIYQFLISVRSNGEQLTNDQGESTSHLMGMFYRTIRMLENGIKPVYVFDGKPPTLKSGELAKRTERREESQKSLAQAQELGDAEGIEKYSKRLTKVTSVHNDECKRLLGLMGIPFVDAPCEAEAQCAAMTRAGTVFATATEDMDTLTFGAPIMLRHLTFSEARKMPISEIRLSEVLQGLQMSYDQFIDLCILLGCDYCESIKGIGPKNAVLLIQKHKTIERVLEHLDTKKYRIPDDWPFKDARVLFKEPEVTENVEIKWTDVDQEGLIEYMVKEKGFNEDRIRNSISKIVKAKSERTQGRLDSFFKTVPKTEEQIVQLTKKRKLEAEKVTAAKKAAAKKNRTRSVPNGK